MSSVVISKYKIEMAKYLDVPVLSLTVGMNTFLYSEYSSRLLLATSHAKVLLLTLFKLSQSRPRARYANNDKCYSFRYFSNVDFENKI